MWAFHPVKHGAGVIWGDAGCGRRIDAYNGALNASARRSGCLEGHPLLQRLHAPASRAPCSQLCVRAGPCGRTAASAPRVVRPRAAATEAPPKKVGPIVMNSQVLHSTHELGLEVIRTMEDYVEREVRALCSAGGTVPQLLSGQ